MKISRKDKRALARASRILNGEQTFSDKVAVATHRAEKRNIEKYGRLGKRCSNKTLVIFYSIFITLIVVLFTIC